MINKEVIRAIALLSAMALLGGYLFIKIAEFIGSLWIYNNLMVDN